MTTHRDLGLLRLVGQRIAGPALGSAVEVVRWLTAAQAQDYPGVLTSVALRTRSRDLDAVRAAFDAGDVVKSWPMRGTLHLTAAEDLNWMLELTTERVVAGAARRREYLGLDLSTVERARELAVEALSGGRRLRREELLAVWSGAGLSTAQQRGYHIIWYLSQTGTLCFGPLRDGEQSIVLLPEWVAHPRRLDRDEALGEWVLRYFRGHGPATVKDFTRWTGLRVSEAKTGLALARPELAAVTVDGVEYLMDPGTPDLLAEYRKPARGVFLLPGFDEYILGYQDRGAVLAPEFADRIVPGGNGVFRPTVVSDGQVVGVWRHTGRGTRRTVDATPFAQFPNRVASAIQKVYATLP